MRWLALALLTVALLVPSAASARPPSVANWHPTWSPDGAWIAYGSSRGGIWLTDGLHTRRLTERGDYPAWSPDGTRVAFELGYRSRNLYAREIRVISVKGGQARFVTGGRLGPAETPSWSPDGRTIAFTGLPRDFGCTDGWAVWTVRPDGGKRSRLTASDEFDRQWEPAWSPDGRRIAFAGQAASPFFYLGLVPASGGRPRVALRTSWLHHPSWSPDGRRLVFVEGTPTNEQILAGPDTVFGPMYVFDLATRTLTRLTNLLGNAPAWSPGGKRIAFATRSRSGATNVYLVEPDGSGLTQLTR